MQRCIESAAFDEPGDMVLQAATKLCPLYVKGHYRKQQALRSLGKESEAAEVQEQIQDFK